MRHVIETGLDSVARTRLVDVLDAIGDPVRLRIMDMIVTAGEVPCSKLDSELGIAKSTVSYHMKMLHTVGLVHTRREGRWYCYQPTELATELIPALQALAQHHLLGDII
jgi:DNA-binding transcriptional ArsR family regulator